MPRERREFRQGPDDVQRRGNRESHPDEPRMARRPEQRGIPAIATRSAGSVNEGRSSSV
jgi:hypothetical protein